MSSHLPRLSLTRRLFRGLRTEGGGPAREAVAVGFGFFIGCTPLYGFHLLLVFACGWLFRLNRLKMYIAANISNPLFAPFLVLLQIQLGAWLERGDLHSLTLQTIRTTHPWTFGLDLIIGSLVTGIVGGLVTGVATYLTARHPDRLDDVLLAAADRYLQRGITAWEFARGKLLGDPIYRAALTGNVLHPGERLIDIGCGQGLMLTALAESRRRLAEGTWPEGLTPPPAYATLIGVDLRPRIAALAATALGSEAEIITGNAVDIDVAPASTVLLFDVLHMMSKPEQERLLLSIKDRLEPGGVVLVREADASAASGFRAVRFGNRLKALVTGNWGQRFAFRSNAEWLQLFAQLGYHAERRDMSAGTPFANVLFVLRQG